MEFMSALDQYGWTIYYFAGFITAFIISIFLFIVSIIGDCFNSFYLDRVELKRQKKIKEKIENEKAK